MNYPSCLRLIIPLLLFTTSIYAQPPIQWQRCLGGTHIDMGRCIQQTSDGGYITVSLTKSNDGDVNGQHGSFDYWVIKLSIAGAIQWKKCLGGSSGEDPYSIRQTFDGGYIVAGSSGSNDGDASGNHGNGDYWIVKLDDTGAIEWQRSLGGSNIDVAYCIRQTIDSGYIVAGLSESTDGDVTGNHGNEDYWVVKLSPMGATQWEQSFGGSGIDIAYSVIQTADSGYIVAGFSYSSPGVHGSCDIWVIKMSASGSLQWQRSYGGSYIDEPTSILQTTDGGYFITGFTGLNDGDVTHNYGICDLWALKISDTGAIQWQKTLGGSGNEQSWAVSNQQTADGGYIIAIYSTSNDGDVSSNHGLADIWAVKLSATGIIQWQRSLGGSRDEYVGAIAQTSDGGFIVIGSAMSNDGDIWGNHGSYDAWIVKLGAVTSEDNIPNNKTVTVIPNPTSGTLYINSVEPVVVKIFNTVGRLMAHEQSNIISLANYPPGMYLVKLFNDNGKLVYEEKIIKE